LVILRPLVPKLAEAHGDSRKCSIVYAEAFTGLNAAGFRLYKTDKKVRKGERRPYDQTAEYERARIRAWFNRNDPTRHERVGRKTRVVAQTDSSLVLVETPKLARVAPTAGLLDIESSKSDRQGLVAWSPSGTTSE
jgi:hypothetical protein